MKPKQTKKNTIAMMDTPLVVPEPLGVVLIMGAWNYPINVLLAPMGGAIAAGNAVILKPSEIAPNVAKCVEELVPRYLDPDCFKVKVLAASNLSYVLTEYTAGKEKCGFHVSEISYYNDNFGRKLPNLDLKNLLE